MHTVLRRRGISGSQSITSPPDPKVRLLDPNACRHPALMAKDLDVCVCRNLDIAMGKLPTVSNGCRSAQLVSPPCKLPRRHIRPRARAGNLQACWLERCDLR